MQEGLDAHRGERPAVQAELVPAALGGEGEVLVELLVGGITGGVFGFELQERELAEVVSLRPFLQAWVVEGETEAALNDAL